MNYNHDLYVSQLRNIGTILKSRKNHLEKKLEGLEKQLLKYPEGALRLSHKGSTPMYYHVVNNREQRTEHYISRKNLNLAEALAQKDYMFKSAKRIKMEVLNIEKLLKIIEAIIECIYEKSFYEQNETRQKLTQLVYQSNEEYAKKWNEMPYERLNPPEDGILTDREERVRSKSELIIANALNSQNIPYRYEQKLTIKGRDIYPDFNILNVRKQKEIIWEHFGLMDDPEYVAKTVRKISEYSANGFQIGDNLIVTFENNHTPLNTIQVNYYIKNFLK